MYFYLKSLCKKNDKSIRLCDPTYIIQILAKEKLVVNAHNPSMSTTTQGFKMNDFGPLQITIQLNQRIKESKDEPPFFSKKN